MRGKICWGGGGITCLAFFSGLALLANAGSTPRQDNAWKRYYNPQWGYCVSYPSRWLKGDAFEGAGIFVETGVKKRTSPIGEIDVSVVSPRSDGVAAVHPAQMNLVDDVQMHLDGLKKFERAQHMEVLEQRTLNLVGTSALFAKERYYEPLERRTWVDEVVFAQHNNVLYRLELACRADQLVRFEPVFTRVVNTFQFECPPRH